MSVLDSARRACLGLLSPAGSRGRLLILTFHQVGREPDPLAPSVPDVKLFADQMLWLKEYCTVLPLPEAAGMLQQGRLPARAACITFDDGYEDNHSVAAPVLRKLSLEATFFITAGAVDDGIMWNDLVIEGIRKAGERLDLTDLGLGQYALADVAARRDAITAVIGQLKYRQPEQRRETAQAVFLRAAQTPGGRVPDPAVPLCEGVGVKPRLPRLMMTRDQVSELSRLGFDIGAHTVNHPILKELTGEEARSEIEGSRDWVQDITGQRPRSFAYPNGRPGIDFTPEHERMVESAGFALAVSTRWGAASREDSPFSLARCAPWERERAAYWQRLARTVARSYVPGGT